MKTKKRPCKRCKKMFAPAINASKKLTNENCRACRKELIIKEDFKSGVYR